MDENPPESVQKPNTDSPDISRQDKVRDDLRRTVARIRRDAVMMKGWDERGRLTKDLEAAGLDPVVEIKEVWKPES
jgi:hypothetical protein